MQPRRLWAPDRPSGRGYRALSALLAPAEWAYGLAVSARGWAFDRGLLKSEAAPTPTLAIGNLTVGGTGKTPIAAWFARTLQSRGQRPAIVMRGYGGDEVEVHERLNPSVAVYAEADRLAGVRRACEHGADVVVLDDAFQHRALRADAQIVLVAVEDWVDRPRLLPRGPWREPLSALGRATLVVATRKAATRAQAESVGARLAKLEPGLPQARAHIRLAGLARYDAPGGRLGSLKPLQGFSCTLAVAGVARPEALWAQLDEAGVSVRRRWSFADHQRYTKRQIVEILRKAEDGPLLATLKDAVKIGPALDPWIEVYVPVQEVVWESGAEEVECLLSNVTGESRAA